MPTPIYDLLRRAVLVADGDTHSPDTVTVEGWIRTSRFAKRVTFLEVYDGSDARTIQIVVSPAVDSALKARLGVGASVRVTGLLVPSRGSEQESEVKAPTVTVVGDCDAALYPVQKKAAGPDYWRSIPHLRVRTKEFQRTFRARSALSQATHAFFGERGFHWVHTPLITFSDCEGAGEMFHVATEGPGRLYTSEGSGADKPHFPHLDSGKFFGKQAGLTVSGQLEVETFCMSLGKVYTFGPTFRAEDSHTSRHASEFWMIEPEIAFASLTDVMDLAEEYVLALLRRAYKDKVISEGATKTYLDCAKGALYEPVAVFARITYTEAMEILEASGKEFQYPIGWGESLQSEHERYLAEVHFGKPVFVTHYPKEQKPFYMRRTDCTVCADGRGYCVHGQATVECFDLLVPGVGEIIGGSTREERLDVLLAQMERCGVDPEEYDWYVDLRRYGTVPHGGFGLGLERLLMWVLGVSNIRDVIPFPRTPA